MAYNPTLVDLASAQAMHKSEQNRREAYTEALMAYSGELPPPLKVETGELDDNIVVNIVAPIVDTGVHYLFGQPFDFDLPGGEIKPEDTPEEEWLKTCLRSNNERLFYNELATNGAIGGTPFYKIDTTRQVPNYTTVGDGLPFPRLQVLDPACMEVLVDDMNIDRVLTYIYERVTTDPKDPHRTMYKRQLCILNDDEQSWTIVDQHAYGSGNLSLYENRVYITDLTTEWPYAWPPYGHCKNLPNPNDVYGRPDITRTLVKANRTINFNLSNRNRIDKQHSFPIIYIIGYNGEVQKLNVGPGKIVNIPGGWMGNNPQFGQLVPAINSTAPRSTMTDTYEYALEETSTPGVLLGHQEGQEANDPSGTALRMKYGPMIKKTETKQGTTYGPMIIEMFRRLLELGRKRPDLVATLHFAELVPNDPLLERQAMEADLRMGLASVETISGKMGYNWQQEKEKIVLEKADGVYPNLQPGQQQGGAMGMNGPRDTKQAANMSAHAGQMSGSNNGTNRPNDN